VGGGAPAGLARRAWSWLGAERDRPGCHGADRALERAHDRIVLGGGHGEHEGEVAASRPRGLHRTAHERHRVARDVVRGHADRSHRDAPGAGGRVLIHTVGRILAIARKEARQLRERLDFLHHVNPDRWPPSSEAELEASLEQWLEPFLAGIRSFSGLDRVDLHQALLNRVDREVRHRLDALAPTHLEVPSGSSIRIDYASPEAPALAVRLQEVFGMTQTPRVGGGRVPLTLKLLSPAHRPVQVTQDLASFWEDAYFEVRKEMRGRYPKHPWPENPLEAEPTRRTKRGR